MVIPPSLFSDIFFISNKPVYIYFYIQIKMEMKEQTGFKYHTNFFKKDAL